MTFENSHRSYPKGIKATHIRLKMSFIMFICLLDRLRGHVGPLLDIESVFIFYFWSKESVFIYFDEIQLIINLIMNGEHVYLWL